MNFGRCKRNITDYRLYPRLIHRSVHILSPEVSGSVARHWRFINLFCITHTLCLKIKQDMWPFIITSANVNRLKKKSFTI